MNTYHTFYKGKKLELKSDTSFNAQKMAALYFKAKKNWEVTVVLVAKGDTVVPFDPSQL